MFFLGQVGFASATIFPFFIHDWLNRGWLKKHKMPTCPDASVDELPKMAVTICVRDEEMVIAGKLSDLARSQYPREKLEVMVVDTGSSDKTMQIVENWINNSPDFGPRVRLLSTTTVSGKSAAVNLALAECEVDSEVFVLTDADSRLSEGALQRLGRWFINPNIGAVCGRQKPVGKDGIVMSNSSSYRTYYNRAREAESRLDSTLIFEGSLAAYRRELINSGVVADANADDSQLALEVRKQGLRAIHDPELHFFEATPNSFTAIHSQRVRRGQGLVGHLLRNRFLLTSKEQGKVLRMTMRSLFYLHILMPIFATLALVCTIGAYITSWPASFGGGLVSDPFTLMVHFLNASFLLFVLAPPIAVNVLRTKFLNPLPASTSFVHAMLVLTWVQIRIWFGLKSHIWRPIPEIRESISIYDELVNQ